MKHLLWQEAAAFAAASHKNQLRQDGRPYISHCCRVAMTVHVLFGFDDQEILAASLLHDTIEDCEVDYDELYEIFGQAVADYVAVMSKDKRLEESIREISYDKQLAEGPWQGRLIKLADVYDNFSDSPPERRAGFVDKVERILVLTKEDEHLQDARKMLETLLIESAPC
jgi:(p)ppGpp synthase/HD superfamily hydrolase